MRILEPAKWSLRTTLMVTMITLLALLALLVGMRLYAITDQTLRNQLQGRAVSVARDVAARSVDLVYSNNLYELNRLVQETLDHNSDIEYIFLIDNSGVPFLSSLEHYVSDALLAANHVPRGSVGYSLVTLATSVGQIHDVAAPIFQGRAGVVRLGINELGLRQAQRELLWQVLLLTVAVSVLGIMVLTQVTGFAMRPVRHLALALSRVGSGHFDERVAITGRDEISQLAKGFNAMASQLAQYRDELAVRERMRMHLVEKVMNAQEDERRRISRELHDEAGQSLTSLKLGLAVLEQADDLSQVESAAQDLRHMLDHTVGEIAAMARDLRPAALEDLGLEAALENLVRQTRGRMDIQVDTLLSLGTRQYPRAVETAMYRILQEILTNTAKHAQAKHISIVLQEHCDHLSMIVEDDGVGFSVASSPSLSDGLGLFGMQERAELLGGTFYVESSVGQGTTIYVTIPMQEGTYGGKTPDHDRG